MLCGLWNKDHASCITEATLFEIGEYTFMGCLFGCSVCRLVDSSLQHTIGPYTDWIPFLRSVQTVQIDKPFYMHSFTIWITSEMHAINGPYKDRLPLLRSVQTVQINKPFHTSPSESLIRCIQLTDRIRTDYLSYNLTVQTVQIVSLFCQSVSVWVYWTWVGGALG